MQTSALIRWYQTNRFWTVGRPPSGELFAVRQDVVYLNAVGLGSTDKVDSCGS